MPQKKTANSYSNLMKCFYIDCAKGTKLFAKELKFKGGLHVFVGSQLRSLISSFKGVHGVPGD